MNTIRTLGQTIQSIGTAVKKTASRVVAKTIKKPAFLLAQGIRGFSKPTPLAARKVQQISNVDAKIKEINRQIVEIASQKRTPKNAGKLEQLYATANKLMAHQRSQEMLAKPRKVR